MTKIFFKRLFGIITYTLCMHKEKRIADMSVKSFELSAAVRGLHVYWDIWLPYINETLNCLHELWNAFDVFAIKYIKGNLIVEHLPRKTSRTTKYLLNRGLLKLLLRLNTIGSLCYFKGDLKFDV